MIDLKSQAVEISELKSPFKVLTGDEFSPEKFPPPEPFFRNLIFFGDIAVIAGPAGIGKTSIAIQLAEWALAGNQNLGVVQCQKVIFFDLETSPNSFFNWNPNIESKNFVYVYRNSNAILVEKSSNFLDFVIKIVDQYRDGKTFIVIDNLQTLNFGEDLLKSDTITKFWTELQQIRDTNTVIVLVHHVRKSENPLPNLNDLFGSSILANLASSIFIVGAEGKYLFLSAVKTRHAVRPSFPLVFQRGEFKAKLNLLDIPPEGQALGINKVLKAFKAKHLRDMGHDWESIAETIGVKSRSTIVTWFKKIFPSCDDDYVSPD